VEATPQMMHFLEKCFFGNSRPVRVFSSWLVATHSKEFSEEVFYRLLEQFRALDDDIVFEPLKRYAEKFPQGFIQSMEQFLEIGGDDG
jgi:hypothetical protein